MDPGARSLDDLGTDVLPGRNFQEDLRRQSVSGAFHDREDRRQRALVADEKLPVDAGGGRVGVRQAAPVADLIFSIPELISYVSTFTPLSPADVIVTGTPGGVGMFREPPLFLEPGDVVKVEVDGVGLLTNVVGTA